MSPARYNIRHGIHGGGNKIDKDSLDSVKKALMDLAAIDTKNLTSPSIGYTSCFGGNYNALVPEKMKIPMGMTERQKISAVLIQQKCPPQLLSALGPAALRVKNNNEKIAINLYFGAVAPRKGDELIIYPADLSLRFANWKQ